MLALILGAVALLLWLSLVIAGSGAPRQAWALLWLPVVVPAYAIAAVAFFVATLGRVHLEIYRDW